MWVGEEGGGAERREGRDCWEEWAVKGGGGGGGQRTSVVAFSRSLPVSAPQLQQQCASPHRLDL